jgi:hypothetical protein
MNLKCPDCGSEENPSDILRCTCGFEFSEKPRYIVHQSQKEQFPILAKKILEPSKPARILIWCLSFAISCFFIISALGWLAATTMMITGKIGNKATEFYLSLNVIDHIVRMAQVIIVVIASGSLTLSRRIATKLFLVNLIISLAAFMFRSKWGISFLPFIFLVVVYGYAYLINRYGFLR